MERLIVEALESAWGNRNIKFQVMVREDRLHIYVNHRHNNRPNYLLLEETVAATVASLNLNVECIRLYCRPLGQVAPNWQTSVELSPVRANLDDIKTIGTSEGYIADNIVTQNYADELELPQVTSANETNFLENNDVATDPNAITDLEIQTTWEQKFDIPEDDNAGDTGLLQSSGLIHGTFLQQEQFSTVPDSIESAIEKSSAPEPTKDLARYCFVTNRRLLTSESQNVAPGKEIMRLVKFFHHLNDRSQFKLLPILEIYFRRSEISGIDDLSPAMQKWLEQIVKLDYDERQMLAIWLSRYCCDPAVTLKEFKAIEAINAEKTKLKKAGDRNTEYNFTPATINRIRSPEKSQLPKTSRLWFPANKLLLPGSWILATIVLLFIALASNFNPTASHLSLCQNTIGSPEYCRLAVSLAGKEIVRPPQSLFPLTKVTESVANYGCQRYANLKAEIALDLTPEQAPAISSSGEKIFPHLYVVHVEQKNARREGSVNVGCVYTTGRGLRAPKLLAADVIPANWTSEPYRGRNNDILSFGKYSIPIDLGLYTIFAAGGIAVASWMNLGIKINRSQAIYLAALVLSVMQLVASTIPVFSSIARVVLPVLALLAMNRLIDDFEISQKNSAAAIAAGIFIVVAVQLILYSVCLGLIASMI